MKRKNNSDKQYIIFGLGRFGSTVALSLAGKGCDVFVVDEKQEKINKIADFVSDARAVSIRDEMLDEDFGDNTFDVAVIGIGEKLDAASIAVMWAVDHNIPRIIAKAKNKDFGRILLKIGATEVIYPEMETGIHLADSLAKNSLLETADLGDNYKIVERIIPKDWAGKNLHELKLRDRYKINVIGIKKLSKFDMFVPADYRFDKSDILVVLGEEKSLEKVIALD